MKKFLPAVLLYLISCTKDNNPPGPGSDLLTSGKWVPESIIYNPPIDYLFNGTLISDVYPYYDSCERDNTLEFALPNILKYDEGPTKCFKDQPQVDYGSWKLVNNDKQVEINDSFTSVVFSFIGSKLIGTYVLPDFDNTNGGKDYHITATLVLK